MKKKHPKKRKHSRLSVLFIGTGRAARGLAAAFSGAGIDVHGFVSRHGAGVPAFRVFESGHEERALAGSDLVVFAVPDEAIAKTAAGLARRCGDVAGKVFVHLSGARDSGDLAPLREKGAHTAALHPFFSFASDPVPGLRSPAAGRAAGLSLRQIPFSIEGSPEAVAIAKSLLDPFGLRAAVIDPHDKAFYHAAAVFCSNFTVGLQATAEGMLREAGVGDIDARLMVSALLTSTAVNVVIKGPREALTGPVVRKDLKTIEMHLSELSRRAPRLVPAYATMTLLLARTQGPKRLGKKFVSGLHALVAKYIGAD